MSSRKSVLVQPIQVIFKFLQQGTRVQVWLYDNLDLRLEGKIIGFDEFMNIVMDEAEEVWSAKAATEKREAREAHRKPLGRLLLKGEVSLLSIVSEIRLTVPLCVTLLQVAPA